MNMSKKASLIHVYNILNKYSDETHRLTRKQIEQYLLLEYDCELNRKTLHDHIQTLNDCGCDIHFATSAKDGYFIAQRLFEPYEIHLLCNAIYASHFIPEKASNDLIQKLFSTQSQYMKKDFNITIDEDAVRKPLQNSFDPYDYAKSKFYMYGGKEERIILKCKYRILDDIIDRFGTDISLQPFDQNHFLAIITSSRQGIIYFCLQYLQYNS